MALCAAAACKGYVRRPQKRRTSCAHRRRNRTAGLLSPSNFEGYYRHQPSLIRANEVWVVFRFIPLDRIARSQLWSKKTFFSYEPRGARESAVEDGPVRGAKAE